MDAPEASPSQSKVTFHNVALSYVPGTAVECRYTLGSRARWASKDWIGLFKVGWKSVRDYYTFVWSSAPHSQTEGSSLECCVRFQASYLPGDGGALYQFCYVDASGAPRGSSSLFTFRDPEPSDELVVVEEFESNSDMLMVMTKTSLLETQLAESERTKGNLEKIQKDLEREVQELGARIQDLETAGETSERERTRLVEQCKSLTEEKRVVMNECRALRKQQGESAGRIRDLEADIQTISHTLLERETALDRARDRAKKLTGEQEEMGKQAREQEEARQSIQAQLDGLKRETRALRRGQGEKDGQVASLKEEVRRLEQMLATTSKAKAQYDAVSEQLRRMHDQLSSSRQEASLMGEELAGAACVRDRTASELHRSRLQEADLEVKLAEVTERWEAAEGRWLEERSVQRQIKELEQEKLLKLSTELLKWKADAQERESEAESLRQELGRERDCCRVQLSEMLRERKEIKSALRVIQKEKEILQNENRELLEYMKILERKVEQQAQAKQREVSIHRETTMDSPRAADPAAGESGVRAAADGSGRPRGTPRSPRDDTARLRYGSPPPSSPGQPPGQVVISQPVPIAISQLPEEIVEPTNWDHTSSGAPPNHLLADLEPVTASGVRAADPTGPQRAEDSLLEGVEGDAADDPWKECPICKQRFPDGYGKQALEHHIDSHFFFSTNDPFTFQ